MSAGLAVDRQNDPGADFVQKIQFLDTDSVNLVQDENGGHINTVNPISSAYVD